MCGRYPVSLPSCLLPPVPHELGRILLSSHQWVGRSCSSSRYLLLAPWSSQFPLHSNRARRCVLGLEEPMGSAARRTCACRRYRARRFPRRPAQVGFCTSEALSRAQQRHLAGPGRVRRAVQLSFQPCHEYRRCRRVSSCALPEVRLGELAGRGPRRIRPCIRRSPLCDRCPWRVDDRWMLWCGSGLAPITVAEVSSTICPAVTTHTG